MYSVFCHLSPDFRLSIAWVLRCPFDGAGDMVQLQSKLEALPPSHGKADWDGVGHRHRHFFGKVWQNKRCKHV